MDPRTAFEAPPHGLSESSILIKNLSMDTVLKAIQKALYDSCNISLKRLILVSIGLYLDPRRNFKALTHVPSESSILILKLCRETVLIALQNSLVDICNIYH